MSKIADKCKMCGDERNIGTKEAPEKGLCYKCLIKKYSSLPSMAKYGTSFLSKKYQKEIPISEFFPPEITAEDITFDDPKKVRKFRTSAETRRILRTIKKMENSWVTIRRMSYKGRGRPRKTDYVRIKVKDILDFRTAELIQLGFANSVPQNYGLSMFSTPIQKDLNKYAKA